MGQSYDNTVTSAKLKRSKGRRLLAANLSLPYRCRYNIAPSTLSLYFTPVLSRGTGKPQVGKP
jgi:hypothetical protein